MRRLILAGFLLSSALLAACATASLPLAAPAGTEAGAAQHNAAGIEHYNAGHWEVAKEHFEAAIKADPQSAEAHYNVGLALDKLGAHADATAHLKKAAELAPGNTAITTSEAYRSHTRPAASGGSGSSGYGGMGGY